MNEIKLEDPEDVKKQMFIFNERVLRDMQRIPSHVRHRAQQQANDVNTLYGKVIANPRRDVVFSLLDAAENENDDVAMVVLGRLYNNPMEFRHRTVPHDPEAARTLFKKAAKRGNRVAMEELGRYYYFGVGGVEDPHKSIQYFYEAALLGDKNAYDSTLLAMRHYLKHGTFPSLFHDEDEELN